MLLGMDVLSVSLWMIMNGWKKALIQKLPMEFYQMTMIKKALSASREDPMGQKGLFKIIILQNKPKKSMSSPVAPEGIDIFYLMD
jgi:hypothetical protein